MKFRMFGHDREDDSWIRRSHLLREVLSWIHVPEDEESLLHSINANNEIEIDDWYAFCELVEESLRGILSRNRLAIEATYQKSGLHNSSDGLREALAASFDAKVECWEETKPLVFQGILESAENARKEAEQAMREVRKHGRH